ncbi:MULTISPECIES: hypothetical protein [Morganellaceae]|uniref:hypothetical protein n=1 Tax=Morganellaceae TaxID=1903414 RepID=UPI000A8C60E4|nr:hypothetical protein [Proteus mirabilis]
MNFIFWFVVLIGAGYLWRRRGWFSKIRKQYSRRKTTLNGNKGCLYNKKMTMMLWKVMGIVIIFILRIKKVSFG